MAVSFEDQLLQVRTLVRVVYGSALLLAALIALKIPPVEPHWGPFQQNFFYSMLMMAVSTFPISGWVRKRFWQDGRPTPEAGGSPRLPGAALMMAALGEACAVYGYALYCVSGNTRWPWLFFLLCAGHYVQTMTRLEAFARELAG